MHLLLLFFACGANSGKNGTDCTMEARSSVSLSIESEQGLEEVSVVFSVNSGESQEATFMEENTWIAGWEQAGNFSIDIEANICPNDPNCICIAQQHLELTVSMTEDQCHVNSEIRTVELTEDDIVEEQCFSESDSGE